MNIKQHEQHASAYPYPYSKLYAKLILWIIIPKDSVIPFRENENARESLLADINSYILFESSSVKRATFLLSHIISLMKIRHLLTRNDDK